LIALRVVIIIAVRESPSAPSVRQGSIKTARGGYLVSFALRENLTRRKEEIHALVALRVVIVIAVREPPTAPSVRQVGIKTEWRRHLVSFAVRGNLTRTKGEIHAMIALRVVFISVRELPSVPSVRQVGIKTGWRRYLVSFAPREDISQTKGVVNAMIALRVVIRRLKTPSASNVLVYGG